MNKTPHLSSINGTSKNSPKTKMPAENYKELITKYNDWVKDCNNKFKQITLKLNNQKKINEVIDIVNNLNKYINYCSDIRAKYKISSQSKFLSSILEEFLIIMCSSIIQLPRFLNKKLQCASETCIVDGYWPDPSTNEMIFPTKDIDCAIYTTQKCLGKEINIPYIGIESKAYVESTMDSSIINKTRSLSGFVPLTLYLAVYELECRSEESIDLANRLNISDQYFCLRKQKRDSKKDTNKRNLKPIDPNIMSDLINKIYNHLDQTVPQ